MAGLYRNDKLKSPKKGNHMQNDKQNIITSDDAWQEDWRLLMGQEGYLMREHLQHRRFDRSICIEDYDECAFCYSSFDEDKMHPLDAYYCANQHTWICEECFNDFKELFHWTVEDIPSEQVSESFQRLMPYFRTIAALDSKAIIICDNMHRILYLNNPARIKYADNDPIGECVYAFRNVNVIWPEVKKRFDWFLEDFNNNEAPVIYDNDRNEALTMIAIRNERNELIGYFVVLM